MMMPFAWSVHGAQRNMSAAHTKMLISREQQGRLERLAAASEDDIDTSDIPEVLDWSGAVRVHLPDAREETVTIQLDADVLFDGPVTDEAVQNEGVKRISEHAETRSVCGWASGLWTSWPA